MVDILKKPIKALKRVDEPNEAQVAKEARKVMLRVKAQGIFQAAREVVRLELEVEWAKMKTQQAKEHVHVLSMNAMVEALKILQGLVLSERETNAQFLHELKEAWKIKGVQLIGEVVKAMKTQTLNPFSGKDTRAKRVRLWVFQVEAYFESQAINTDVVRLKLVQFMLKDHALEW